MLAGRCSCTAYEPFVAEKDPTPDKPKKDCAHEWGRWADASRGKVRVGFKCRICDAEKEMAPVRTR